MTTQGRGSGLRSGLRTLAPAQNPALYYRQMSAALVLNQMHRRKAIQPITTPTQYELLELLRNHGFTVDQNRLDRVFTDPQSAMPIHGNITITVSGDVVSGLVKGTYTARIEATPAVDCDCNCPDWLQSGGKANRMPCKHILGLAVDASLAGQLPGSLRPAAQANGDG